MTAEWFQESEGPIVETAWGRFQDTPIFRSLAWEHNVAVSKLGDDGLTDSERDQRGSAYLAAVMSHLSDEERDATFRKALLIQAIAEGGYGE